MAITIWRDDCSFFCIITSKTQKKGVDNLMSTPENLLKQKSCQRIFGRIFGRKPNQFISFYQSLIALKDW
ncbi:hypothetical protein [Streptococcus pyogenes]|uniref:hypothetical protein n=1 Tax=Streptococcus pyogenes TaxID=1314 RepID=UPI0018807F26|nr:hypothetical protein [Streptococcus pyogenes]